MSGTARTIAYELDRFKPVASGGVIKSAQDMVDLVATLSARTGNGTINLITAPEFGADPTGVANSTTAIQNCMAAGVAVAPPGTYLVNNCVVPNGGVLIAFTGLEYGNTLAVAESPKFKPLNSSVAQMFNVDNKTNIFMQGIVCDMTSGGASTNGWSYGSKVMTLRDCSALNGNIGFGGVVSGGSGLTSHSQLTLANCQAWGCTLGLGNVVDGWIIGGALSFCNAGWIFDGSSGSTTMLGTRIEWNVTYGVDAGNASRMQFTGVLFDRNGTTGVRLTGSFKYNFANCYFARNGYVNDANSSHIIINNGASSMLFTGNLTSSGTDDGGGGNNTPPLVVRYQGTISNNIMFNGNDLQGYTATASNTAWRTGTIPTANYVVKNNFGTGTAAQDVDTR